MDISVVIVNYKSREKLINCLKSLDRVDWLNLRYEIIIVENDSGDKLDDLVPLYKNVKLVISKRNLGMGGGNNLGISKSSGKYILVANPDLIFKEGSISAMHQYLEKNREVAIVGPQLFNPDLSLQYSCARFPSVFLPLFRRTVFGRYFPNFSERYLMKKTDHSQVKEVDWLLGACLLVRRDELFVNDKLFDERFFMYFEDVDLGKRARLLNKKTVYLPIARVVHDHMRSSARLPWYKAIFFDKLAREHLKSWWLYFRKWYFN